MRAVRPRQLLIVRPEWLCGPLRISLKLIARKLPIWCETNSARPLCGERRHLPSPEGDAPVCATPGAPAGGAAPEAQKGWNERLTEWRVLTLAALESCRPGAAAPMPTLVPHRLRPILRFLLAALDIAFPVTVCILAALDGFGAHRAAWGCRSRGGWCSVYRGCGEIRGRDRAVGRRRRGGGPGRAGGCMRSASGRRTSTRRSGTCGFGRCRTAGGIMACAWRCSRCWCSGRCSRAAWWTGRFGVRTEVRRFEPRQDGSTRDSPAFLVIPDNARSGSPIGISRRVRACRRSRMIRWRGSPGLTRHSARFPRFLVLL